MSQKSHPPPKIWVGIISIRHLFPLGFKGFNGVFIQYVSKKSEFHSSSLLFNIGDIHFLANLLGNFFTKVILVFLASFSTDFDNKASA